MTKLTRAQAARLINRCDKTLRTWTATGLVPRDLTFADLPRLRALAGFTKKQQEDAPEKPRE